MTAEISTMRLDMGDMQEALKAHDAWMEDVSQSLQEVHERCQQLSEDIGEHAQSTQAKFDAKTDITAWNDMNDDIDASIKTVRDMASALRLEVDSRRRKVDEDVGNIRETLKTLTEKVDTNANNIQRNSAMLGIPGCFFDACRLFDVATYFVKGNSQKIHAFCFVFTAICLSCPRGVQRAPPTCAEATWTTPTPLFPNVWTSAINIARRGEALQLCDFHELHRPFQLLCVFCVSLMFFLDDDF